MRLMASLLVHFVTGFSFPLEPISLSTPAKPRDEVSVLLLYAKDAKPRMILTVVGLTCMFALAFMMGILISTMNKFPRTYPLLGLRARRDRRQKLNFANILVYIQVLLAFCYVVSSAIVKLGLGIITNEECYSAIIICLVFYTSTKMAL
jgi:hypothetical protein